MQGNWRTGRGYVSDVALGDSRNNSRHPIRAGVFSNNVYIPSPPGQPSTVKAHRIVCNRSLLIPPCRLMASHSGMLAKSSERLNLGHSSISMVGPETRTISGCLRSSLSLSQVSDYTSILTWADNYFSEPFEIQYGFRWVNKKRTLLLRFTIGPK